MTYVTSPQCGEPGAGAAGPPGLGRASRRGDLVGGGGGRDLPRPAGPGGQGPAGCRHRAVQKYQPTDLQFSLSFHINTLHKCSQFKTLCNRYL